MRSAAKWIWIFIVIAFVFGFLLVETSGLLGRERISTSTVVGEVNGTEIPYLTWTNLANNLAQNQERQGGQSMSLDERRRVDDQAFEQLVTEILLQQEYKKRGIKVTDAEVIQAAQFSPPPELMQNPELQTDGQFDIAKYQRLLKSSAARQNGLLVQLENYYRNEIPRAKLYDQLAGDVYVTDAKLWSIYRDLNDSAQVSFVKFDARAVPDSAVTVPDAEMRSYYDKNKKRFERPGRAAITLLTIPREITSADSAAARDRAAALREEIVRGATFEDIAKRESADTISGARGGSLGRGAKGRFIPEFENAAFALKVGEVSQPVKTQFGYHLIRVDEKKGDTLDLRHILIRIQQSDSSASRTDKRADSLVTMAASGTVSAKFDSAATALKLTPQHVEATEGQPLTVAGVPVPSVSAWAFGGVKPGESSELFDSDRAYYLARLDTITQGGVPPFDAVKNDIRAYLAEKKKAEVVLPKAAALSKQATGSSFEAAAKAADVTVTKSEMFTRSGFVPGLGRLNEAVGAAFSLPVGTVSAPVVTDDGVFVLRVERRVQADSSVWEKQKDAQRKQAVASLRESRVRNYMDGLRKASKIKDRRKELNEAARAQSTATS
jgi:peptidyl-prolyl cis-trans isomerase D